MMTRSPSVIVRALSTGVVVGLVVGGAVSLLPAAPATAAAPATSSTVTVSTQKDALTTDGAPFPNLTVTVSQTTDLVSQGIMVSWKGGKESTRPSGGIGGENFMQIAQCWGEDPDNPGHPDRTTCQYGAALSSGATRNDNVEEKNVHPRDAAFTVPRGGQFLPAYSSIPFRASDGTVITDIATAEDGSRSRIPDVDVNTNQFFTELTTNEVKWAGSASDGSGSVPFELQTAMQSPGLGCGRPLTSGTAVTGQSCWLVVIPRATGDSGTPSISKSGLYWDAWQHHLAVKLDFAPLGVRCAIGSAEKQLAGSELAAAAISSWQPQLCGGATGSAFVLRAGNEADALAQASGVAASPLALTSRPLATDEPDPLEYAPVALSALAVSFAIDRQVVPVGSVPAEYRNRDSLPFAEMNLTPRLVAKLLTSSYLDALPSADKSHVGFVSNAQPGRNPRTLTMDPEFRAVNDPEWSYQVMVSPSVADLLVPSGRSDLIHQVWSYVMADAKAAAWLAGEPDEHGMVVNPWYSTNPKLNPSGTGLSIPRDNFPKADPIEKPDTTISDPVGGTGPINLVTWRPYLHDFESSAYLTLRGDGQVLGDWNRLSIPAKYGKSVRELLGSQKVMGMTTAPAAHRYQTVTARLQNSAGAFVAPTAEGMLAAAAAMEPFPGQDRVRHFVSGGERAQAAPTAYPLTIPVYAALNPLQDDAAQRAVYAALIRYAAGPGQVLGTELGQLPIGYAPLPAAWGEQAMAAAHNIEQGISPLTRPAASATPPSGGHTRPAASAAGAVPQASSAIPGRSMPAPAVDPATGASPVAQGTPAGSLTGAATPADPRTGGLTAAVPLGAASGLLAAAMVPFVGRIRRRA